MMNILYINANRTIHQVDRLGRKSDLKSPKDALPDRISTKTNHTIWLSALDESLDPDDPLKHQPILFYSLDGGENWQLPGGKKIALGYKIEAVPDGSVLCIATDNKLIQVQQDGTIRNTGIEGVLDVAAAAPDGQTAIYYVSKEIHTEEPQGNIIKSCWLEDPTKDPPISSIIVGTAVTASNTDCYFIDYQGRLIHQKNHSSWQENIPTPSMQKIKHLSFNPAKKLLIGLFQDTTHGNHTIYSMDMEEGSLNASWKFIIKDIQIVSVGGAYY